MDTGAPHPTTTPAGSDEPLDVAIVGAGQSGLACGYFLQRWARDVERGRQEGPVPRFALFDSSAQPGGSWPHHWPSLRLFSPAEHSSLPGRRMPGTGGENPDADHVVEYLTDYEDRYGLPVRRGTRVAAVSRQDGLFALEDDDGRRLALARTVVSATGSFTRPFVPAVPGAAEFAGRQVHSSAYTGPEEYAGLRVLVVGGGNSGAQIAADLHGAATSVTWATLRPPRFMPDDVDGSVLFRLASARVLGREVEQVGTPGEDLGDIVVVPPVRAARDAGALDAVPSPSRFTEDAAAWDADAGREHGWPADAQSRAATAVRGTEQPFDAVVWCTGFRPELRHLRTLLPGARPRMRQQLRTASADVAGLYLLGYGDYCGPASATLVGVGVFARATVADIAARLRAQA
ncbi:NAD(P)-binding domain-containing protein [Micrococcus luteus]